MLPYINEISTFQYVPNQDTLTKSKQVLYYKATHPLAKIQYHARHMILMTDTDTAYLALPSACSCIAGHFSLTNRILDYSKRTPTPNGPILTEFKTLKTIVSSSAKAETGGTFENAQNVISLPYLLKTVFLHPQHKEVSPIITNNLTSRGILTHFIETRKFKTWDMQYHWLEDIIQQKQIQLI